MEVANLNFFFDADAHFVCLPKESQPQPPTGVAHTPASQLSGPFSCTCPLLASVWACSTTPGQGANAGSARLPLNSARAHMAAVAFNERGSRDLRYGEVRHCALSFGALEIDTFFCRPNCFERKKWIKGLCYRTYMRISCISRWFGVKIEANHPLSLLKLLQQTPAMCVCVYKYMCGCVYIYIYAIINTIYSKLLKISKQNTILPLGWNVFDLFVFLCPTTDFLPSPFPKERKKNKKKAISSCSET